MKHKGQKLQEYSSPIEEIDMVSDLVAGNYPVKKYRAGAISATIWSNKTKQRNGEDQHFETISLQRVYKDAQGNWKHTTSLRVSDLPKVQMVMQKVYADLVLKEQELFKGGNS